MPRNFSELKSGGDNSYALKSGGGGDTSPPSPTDRRPCLLYKDTTLSDDFPRGIGAFEGCRALGKPGRPNEIIAPVMVDLGTSVRSPDTTVE